MLAAATAAVVYVVLAARSRADAVRLYEACFQRNEAAVTRLLSAGVSASASYTTLAGLGTGEPSLVKHVPLIVAAERGGGLGRGGGGGEIVALLIQHGASVDATNEWGETALMVACRKDNYDAAAVLLAHGASMDARCERGRTPLLWAVGYGSPKLVAMLLERGAPGGVDSVGSGVLDLAGRRQEPARQQILDLIRNKK